MREQDYKVWKLVQNSIGKTIKALHVILYAYREQYDWSDIPMQLNFQDGSTLLLQGHSNGERLQASERGWEDPFEGKLDEANQQYINQHGRWIQQDVTAKEPYSQLIGKKILEVLPITNQFSTLSGVCIKTQSTWLNFFIEFDQCHILWGEDNAELQERGFSTKNIGSTSL